MASAIKQKPTKSKKKNKLISSESASKEGSPDISIIEDELVGFVFESSISSYDESSVENISGKLQESRITTDSKPLDSEDENVHSPDTIISEAAALPQDVTPTAPVGYSSSIHFEAQECPTHNSIEVSDGSDKNFTLQDCVMKCERHQQNVTGQECLPYEDIEILYGSEKIELCRRFASVFQSLLDRTVYKAIRLFRKLMSYKDMINLLDREKKRVYDLISKADKGRESLWIIENKTASGHAKCADNETHWHTVNYDYARFNKEKVKICHIHYQEAVKENAESFCLRQHLVIMLRNKIEDMVCSAMSDENETKEFLHVMFHILQIVNHDVDKLFVEDLHSWCYALATKMLTNNNCLSNQLFLVHHLLRQSHNITWAVDLLQPRVDLIELLCLIEVIVSPLSTQPPQELEGESQGKEETELWEVVESNAEWGGALDPENGVAESTLLLLLSRIPLRELLASLAFVTQDYNDMVIITQLDEAKILRVCGTARMLLHRLAVGIETHRKLPRLAEALCRITLHTLLCIYDASCLLTQNKSPAVSAELESVFDLGWNIFQQCIDKDAATHFMAQMPYQMVSSSRAQICYKNIVDSFDFANEQQCMNQIDCKVNMALATDSQEFAADVIFHLYKVGFRSEKSKSKIGKKARKGLSILLKQTQQFYPLTLAQVSLDAAASPESIKPEWLSSLELANFRPSSPEMSQLMEQWISHCPHLLPAFIDCLELEPPGGIPMEVQRSIALSLVTYARSLSMTKKPPPEWIYHKLMKLKLHYTEWNVEINTAPPAEQLGYNKYIKLEEDIPFCMFLLLSSSWGHSVPLVCDFGVPVLIKMVDNERKAEAIHCFSYIMKIMMDAPDSIAITPSFGLLLKALLKTQSYVTRLWTTDNTETNLEKIIHRHLLETNCGSLEAWCQFLMLDGIGMKLLERIAANIYHKKQIPVPDDLTILETYGRNYPHLGLVLLRHRHYTKESPYWPSLLSMLHLQRSGTVNVDDALKGLEPMGKSSDLAIYRTAEAALQTSIDNPAHVLLWDFFFQLYRQAAPTCRSDEFKPVGPLFYRGFKISMTLSKMKKRLQETLAHHNSESKKSLSLIETLEKESEKERVNKQKDFLSNKSNISSDSFEELNTSNVSEDELFDLTEKIRNARAIFLYHQTIVKYMQCYTKWLDEESSSTPLPPIIQINDLLRCPILLTAYVLHELKISRKLQIDQKSKKSLVAESSGNNSPATKILNRLKTYEVPRKAKPPDTLQRIERPSHSAILKMADSWISELKEAAYDFIKEKSITELLNMTLFDTEYTPSLYYSKPFTCVTQKSCGKPCTGKAVITVQGVEWLMSSSVSKQILEVVGRRNAAWDISQRPRLHVARMATYLLAVTEYVSDKVVSSDLFWLIAKTLNDVDGCPLISDTLQTAALKLAKNASFNDEVLVRTLEGQFGEAMSRIATEIARDRTRSPNLYSGLLGSNVSPSVTYSILSKFSMNELVEDLVPRELNNILDVQLDCLSRFGCETSNEVLPLLELVCLQVGSLVRARPFCACACVRKAARVASEGSLSRLSGEGLMNYVASVAPLLEPHQVIGFCMDLGTAWREREGWKRNSEHANTSAALVFTVLQILTNNRYDWQACVQCVWSSWEAWTGGANTGHFLDIILKSYPESRDDILRYWLIAMSRVSPELSGRDVRELNPSTFANQSSWYHPHCLSALVMMSGGKMELRSWLASALRGVSASNWLRGASGLQELYQTFHLLTTLPVNDEMIKDAAENLPWDMLTEEQFERILHDYLIKNHANADPCFFRTTFKLICGAGLREPRAKLLVTRWALILSSSNGFRTGVAPLLSHITSAYLAYSKNVRDKNAQSSFCETLLGRAIVVLTVHPFADLYLPEFVNWLSSAPPALVSAMLRVVSDITLSDTFLHLSEVVIRTYLANGGTWRDVSLIWKNSCFVDEALTSEYPVTMAATLLFADTSQQHLSLDKLTPSADTEPQTCLVLLAIVWSLTDTSENQRELNNMRVINKIHSWASPPPSLLSRALTLNRAPVMSPRMRAASTMALVCLQSIQDSSSENKKPTVEGFEEIFSEFNTNLTDTNIGRRQALAKAFFKIFPSSRDLFSFENLIQ